MTYSGKYRAKRSLGQNFLIDPRIIDRILNVVNAGPEQSVLEVGPGQGALTAGLLKTGCRLHCVEYDRELAEHLRLEFGGNGNFTLTEEDILKYDWSSSEMPDQIIGNLPYNISSQILFKVFDSPVKPRRLVIMLQKEVGERLLAGPGSKTYGILSVAAALHASGRIEFIIYPESFRPRPRVDSVLVTLDLRSDTDPRIDDLKLFRFLVKRAFNQRRKTLKNSLAQWYLPEFEQRFDWKARPETLSLQQFIELYLLLKVNPLFSQ